MAIREENGVGGEYNVSNADQSIERYCAHFLNWFANDMGLQFAYFQTN